jgi:hypothetical protein
MKSPIAAGTQILKMWPIKIVGAKVYKKRDYNFSS